MSTCSLFLMGCWIYEIAVALHNMCLKLHPAKSNYWRILYSGSYCWGSPTYILQDTEDWITNDVSKGCLAMAALLSVTSVAALWKHIVCLICTVSHYSSKFLALLSAWYSYPFCIPPGWNINWVLACTPQCHLQYHFLALLMLVGNNC